MFYSSLALAHLSNILIMHTLPKLLVLSLDQSS